MRLPIGTVIVALAAASCAPGDEATPTAGRGPALVEVEGPVVGLTIAAAIDERGDVVDPGRIFAASAPQIAAVAFAGPSPGEAVFEWYALAPGAGEEPQRTKLFEHRVAAGPLARAFSVGTSPGRLTPGTYAVVASLGGASRTAKFEVAGAHGAAAAAAPAGQEGPPQSGESGTRGGTVAEPPYPSQPLANLRLSGLEGPPLEVMFSTEWASFEPAPNGFTAEASIAAGGAPRTVRIAHPAGVNMELHPGALDPCGLEGGSDLPGTRLTVTLRFVEGGPGKLEVHPADPALGPDQTRPTISTFDPSKPDRARVQKGEVIGFDVIARDQNHEGLTWQTGVRRLEVLANGQPVAGAVVEGPPQAPSCDDSARVLNLQGEYRVPRNPPPVIRLCARAEDYVPNTTERCVTYATANVWKGTAPSMRSEVVYSDGAARCADVWRLDFTFVESQDGTLSGDGTADLVTDLVCQPTFPGAHSPSRRLTYTVEGERRGDAFILRFGATGGTGPVGWAAVTQGLGEPVPVAIPTLGDRGSADARWTYSHVDPTGTRQNYKVEGKITIECQQCAPGVG